MTGRHVTVTVTGVTWHRQELSCHKKAVAGLDPGLSVCLTQYIDEITGTIAWTEIWPTDLYSSTQTLTRPIIPCDGMLDRGLDVPAVLNLLPEDIFAVLRLRCICASWSLWGKSSTSFCQEDFPSWVGCQPEAGLKGIVHYFSMSVLKVPSWNIFFFVKSGHHGVIDLWNNSCLSKKKLEERRKSPFLLCFCS